MEGIGARMINRIVLIVIDGLGIGPLPDAGEYGDAEANTLAHIADAVGGLSLPTMEALGLRHIAQVRGVNLTTQPSGGFGRLGFTSRGKDSVAGYWETNGVILRDRTPDFAGGIPAEVVDAIEQALGRKVIGTRVASMGFMLSEYGADHMASGAPIVWTDGGATCYIGAHESVIPQSQLQQQCREAWKVARKAFPLIRLVARPIAGEPGSFHPHGLRKDFIVEPPGVTMLDALNRAGQIVMGVGKVHDVFNGRSLTRHFPAATATEAFDETVGMLTKVPRGLIYTSLDLLPEDSVQAGAALEEFDRRLPDLFEKLRQGDVCIITSDHGRDMSKPEKRPTREYVPLLITGPKVAHGVDFGTHATAADLGQTIVEALQAERLPFGESFWQAIKP